MLGWVWFLLGGYLLLGRPFAYIGLPPLKIFIGEISLVAFGFFYPSALFGRISSALTSRSPLSPFTWAFFLSLVYGLLEVLHGIYLGYPPFQAIQTLVFNIYPLYFFIGVWAGLRSPNAMPRFVRWMGWLGGAYGMAYVLILSRLPWVIPGSHDVPVFGQTGATLLVLFGYLCFEKNLMKVLAPLLMNVLVMLALQVRAEWLAFLIGLVVWSFLTGRLGRLGYAVAGVAVLLIAGYVTDFTLPSPKGRGGAISSREIVTRIIAPVAPELAAENSKNARFYAGTMIWRTLWWEAIWRESKKDAATALVGHGYGFPLWDLSPVLHREEIRTPHSVFFFTLAYTGWMQLALGHLAWRSFRLTGIPLGLMFWIVGLVAGLFGNVFETPFGAIPNYLLMGVLTSCVVGRSLSVSNAYPTGSQLLPATRG